MLELNVYKNTDSTSAQYGKAYARVDYKEMFDVSKVVLPADGGNSGE